MARLHASLRASYNHKTNRHETSIQTPHSCWPFNGRINHQGGSSSNTSSAYRIAGQNYMGEVPIYFECVSSLFCTSPSRRNVRRSVGGGSSLASCVVGASLLALLNSTC